MFLLLWKVDFCLAFGQGDHPRERKTAIREHLCRLSSFEGNEALNAIITEKDISCCACIEKYQFPGVSKFEWESRTAFSAGLPLREPLGERWALQGALSLLLADNEKLEALPLS